MTKLKTVVKRAIRWSRPKAKNTDLTITSSVIGHRAQISVLKGGGSILVHQGTGGDFVVHSSKDSIRHYFSMGELEAIALIYAKLQEPK